MIILSDDIIFRKAVIHLLNVELGKFAPAQPPENSNTPALSATKPKQNQSKPLATIGRSK